MVLALPGILVGSLICNQLRLALHQRLGAGAELLEHVAVTAELGPEVAVLEADIDRIAHRITQASKQQSDWEKQLGLGGAEASRARLEAERDRNERLANSEPQTAEYQSLKQDAATQQQEEASKRAAAGRINLAQLAQSNSWWYFTMMPGKVCILGSTVGQHQQLGIS